MLNTNANHDIFLSHRYADRDAVQRLHDYLKDGLGYSVYVDWIEHPELDRSEVTPDTAEHFRRVMRGCSILLFYAGPNAPQSKWMPWELGFFDGRHGARRIAVYVDNRSVYDPAQQEYLRLYRAVDRASVADFLDEALNDTAAMTSATTDQLRRHAEKFARDPVDYGLSVVQWQFGVAANVLLDPQKVQLKADEQPQGQVRDPAFLYDPWYKILRQQQATCAQMRREWRRKRKSFPSASVPLQWPYGGLGALPNAAAHAVGIAPKKAIGNVAMPLGDFAAAVNKALIDMSRMFMPSTGSSHDENWFT